MAIRIVQARQNAGAFIPGRAGENTLGAKLLLRVLHVLDPQAQAGVPRTLWFASVDRRD
ncbi:MAG: hypothetical protein ABSE28_16760 [Candidatus Sulfotelmatobacter sp.]